MRAKRVLALVAMCTVSLNALLAQGQSISSSLVVPAKTDQAAGPASGRSGSSISISLTSSAERATERPSSGSVLGALMLCGGGPLPETLLQTFFELGQSTQGSLVIIPSASVAADLGDYEPAVAPWRRYPWASVQILHANDRQQIENDTEFLKPLQQATAVWISGGDQRRLAERYLGTPVEHELKGIVKRGGIIGGTSAGSAIASRVMISGGRQQPVIASGLDLLPGAIIDQHFSQRQRYERLASAVQQHPDRVGIGIDESTGLVVNKREARVLGSGSVYIYPRTVETEQKHEPLKFDAGSAFDLPEFVSRQD
jgi:cyanophycinase